MSRSKEIWSEVGGKVKKRALDPWTLKVLEQRADLEGFKHRYRTSQVASVIKNPPTSAGDSGDSGSILGSGRSPGEVNGNLLPWWATVHGVAKSQTHLSD